VKTPALIVQGTDDRRVSVAVARHLAEHLPDARLHLFEGRGHLPIFTVTAEFCDVLRRFVRRDG
jgi:pimeloyl-ACP methyl ester carboxylesterase